MSRTALFPGSFDPITTGHVDIVMRGLSLFDKIIIAVGTNSAKQYLFTRDERIQWIRKTFENEPKISVEEYAGLTVDFCKKMNASYILRGLRTAADFEFETAIARMNRYMENNIETVFISSAPELSPVSSTIVRDIIKNGGNAKPFVASGVNLK